MISVKRGSEIELNFPHFLDQVDAREIAHRFGRRLTWLRSQYSMSLRDLEARTGMSAGTIGKIARGEQTVNLHQLLMFKQAFELGSLEELLGELPSTKFVQR